MKHALRAATSAFRSGPLPTVFLSVVALIGGPAACALGQEPAEAVGQAAAAFHEALADGNIDAAEKFWTAEADYVDQHGHAFKMQAALAAAKARWQKDGRIGPPTLKTETLAIRLISPDVAIEDGVIEHTLVAENQQAKGRFCAVWVKRDGKWLIDGVRESSYSPVTSSDHFAGFDWLIGEWVAEGPTTKAEATYTWGPNRKYVLAHLKIIPQGRPAIIATQWIGWDPLREQLRSFAYDADGGFQESVWTHEDDAWVISSTGVNGEGERIAGTSIFTRVDEQSATWEYADEAADGRPGTDMQLRATRKAGGR